MSLKHALEIYPTLIESIKLEDNAVKDSDLSKILLGLRQLESLKEIHIEKNIYLGESLEQLDPILKRHVPNNLEVLRLVSIRTGPLVTGKITELLADGCHLRKLTLSNAELSDFNMRETCSIIKNARFLIYLDISRNKMTP